MSLLRTAVATALQEAVRGRPAVVFANKSTDAHAWRQLLHAAGVADLNVLPLDVNDAQRIRPGHRASADEPAVTDCAVLGDDRERGGIAGQLAAQHQRIRELIAARSPTDAFGRSRDVVLLAPDPLDPIPRNDEVFLGSKSPFARMVEDKTLVDAVWDAAGVPRVASTVCDPNSDLATLVSTVDRGTGVVVNVQPRGGRPQAAGEGIRWQSSGSPFVDLEPDEHVRLRLMPLLYGLPCRIHGMIICGEALVFPPLELVSLPRPASHTFFWAGAVLARTLTPETRVELHDLALRLGRWLGRHGHHGAFAADGIITPEGFRPTELTTRLTSAFEGASATERVLLHAANLLARDGWPIDHHAEIGRLAEAALGQGINIYGAATTATTTGMHPVRWIARGASETHELVPSLLAHADGLLTLRDSDRGHLLHAALDPAALPRNTPMGVLAAQIFALADELFGAGFGELAAPFGLQASLVPPPRSWR